VQRIRIKGRKRTVQKAHDKTSSFEEFGCRPLMELVNPPWVRTILIKKKFVSGHQNPGFCPDFDTSSRNEMTSSLHLFQTLEHSPEKLSENSYTFQLIKAISVEV
jgi:hypothetical protein